ncbi:MAG: hypothetical protein WD749_06015 [Phycisphaerales bacterium]
MGDNTPTVPAPPATRRSRLLIALALTVLIAAMPMVGAMVAERWADERVDRDLLISVSILATCGGGAAWLGLLLFRLVRAVNARERTRALAAPSRIDNLEIVRALLADRDFACRRCGYNLRGLPAGACPECHEPIELWLGGAATLRPLAWITRLAVLALLGHAIASGVLLYTVFGLLGFMGRGRAGDMLAMILVYMAGPVVCFGGLLTIAGLWTLHAQGGAAATRDVLRWRVLRTVVTTFFLIILLHLAALGWEFIFR